MTEQITAEQAQKQLAYFVMAGSPQPTFVDIEAAFRTVIAQAEELARLRADLAKAVEALRPFADCVFNDNGDVTISYGDLPGSSFVTAYFTLKEITHD